MRSRNKAKAFGKVHNGNLEGSARPVGRLRVDFSDESTEATRVLLEAGFRIITVPVSGMSEPELSIGPYAYRGISEIRHIARKYRR